MKNVKYKDKDREFEMPTEAFIKSFDKDVMLELLKTKDDENLFQHFWKYFKSLPIVLKIMMWLKS